MLFVTSISSLFQNYKKYTVYILKKHTATRYLELKHVTMDFSTCMYFSVYMFMYHNVDTI